VDESTSLHGFPDIENYSRLNAYQQAEFQEGLAKCIEVSLVDAGVRLDCMRMQDQGDARMLTFPDHLDVSKVLAVMTRRFNDELGAFNRDRAAHARMRVRLAFALGPSAPGRTGQRGIAPITVARLNNAPALRAAMAARPGAYLGVVIDDYLYHQYVAQQFRPDLAIDEYTQTHVSLPDKDFTANAWIRLVGYRADEWLADASLTRPGTTARGAARKRTPRRSGGAGEDNGEGAGDDPGHGGERGRGRRHLTQAAATVVAAMIVAGVSLVIAFSGHNGPSGGSPTLSPSVSASHSQPPPSTATDAPTATSGTQSPGTGGAAFTEYADWGPGVQVYADNRATASNAPVIPFNQPVTVACVAQNDSGIVSINAFYRIVSGPWRGTYASCNEFTNGGARESASDPSIDPRVQPCSAS
jgi:hypothetical protein